MILETVVTVKLRTLVEGDLLFEDRRPLLGRSLRGGRGAAADLSCALRSRQVLPSSDALAEQRVR